MDKLPTAEEFIREKIRENYSVPQSFSLSQFDYLNAEKAMKWVYEYSVLKTKFHCEAQAKVIAEKAKLEESSNYGFYDAKTAVFKPYWAEVKVSTHQGHGDCTYSAIRVDKNTILNAYPLDNIK